MSPWNRRLKESQTQKELHGGKTKELNPVMTSMGTTEVEWNVQMTTPRVENGELNLGLKHWIPDLVDTLLYQEKMVIAAWATDKNHDNDLQAIDVAEAYSPPRFVPVAAERGLDVGDGVPMEFTTGWDFSKPSARREAVRVVMDKKPRVLISSVMCRDWSILMHLNWAKLGREERERRMANARMHLAFVCKLAMLQHSAGRYFVHEHPALARSWLKRTSLSCRDGPERRSWWSINACMVKSVPMTLAW